MGIGKKLARPMSYNTELVMSPWHKPGWPESPTPFTFGLCTLYPLAQDIGKIDHSISNQCTGATLPLSIPVKSIPFAEDATGGFFNRFKITIPSLLEFLNLFV
jgi:hypothetical protein